MRSLCNVIVSLRSGWAAPFLDTAATAQVNYAISSALQRESGSLCTEIWFNAIHLHKLFSLSHLSLISLTFLSSLSHLSHLSSLISRLCCLSFLFYLSNLSARLSYLLSLVSHLLPPSHLSSLSFPLSHRDYVEHSRSDGAIVSGAAHLIDVDDSAGKPQQRKRYPNTQITTLHYNLCGNQHSERNNTPE